MNLPDSQLPVPIGNEMELQIVNGKGEILRGEELIKVWDAIFAKVEATFKQSLDMVPEYIRKRVGKVKRVTKEKSGKQLPYLEIEYKTFKTFNISVIGPDPNISQVTWLMELVTPPATTMAEFAWWNVLLNTVLVKSLPPGYWILPLGLNPAEKEYSSGVTFGEHYHIGFDDDAFKLAAYTLIRDFLPHLIALTVNSPFINKKATGVVKVADEDGVLQILGKDCTKSLRLFYNKAQMGPVDKETYIPCLKVLDKKEFCDVVHRKPPDDRFVDMYPFTSYGTIELRVFDTQFALSRRLAIVALVETLCLKAKRLLEKGERIPCVLSAVLVANREKAVVFGLHGKFTPDTTLPGSFGMTYNEDPLTGKQNGKIFQAVKSMLFFLKKEIADLGLKEVMVPIRLSIEGNEEIKAPVTQADYLLYLAGQRGGSIEAILPNLKKFQTAYCTGTGIDQGDPLVDEWGVPAGEQTDGHSSAEIDSSRAITSHTAIPHELPAEIDFTGVAASAPEQQLKVVKAIPYQLTFTASSSAPRNDVEILAIQQLIEIQKKSEIILATSFKRLPVPANKAITITQDDFPLIPAQDIFIGNKQCRLKFVLKEQKEATTYSNAFWVELLPRYVITSDFKKKRISPGEKVEVKYKVSTAGNAAPQSAINMDLKFQVVSADGTAVLHQASRYFPVKDADSASFAVAPIAAWKEREVNFRLTAVLNEKIIARHEIEGIFLDIPKEKPDTFTLRLAEKKSDTWPSQKVPTTAQSTVPTNTTKYGLVKQLEFSSKHATGEPGPVARVGATPVLPAKPTSPPSPGARDKGHSPPAKQQVSGPSKANRAQEPVSKPRAGTVGIATQPASITTQHAPEGKAEQARMASLLTQNGAKKPRGKVDAVQVPFLEPINEASVKVEITSKLISPRLVAPGEKIIITYTMKKASVIGENEFLKLVAFLVNARQEFIVVLNEKYKFQGETSTFTLTVDPSKNFKEWKPTDPFHVVLQAYIDNTLVGQAIYNDFELATFTTSSQITWRKVDILSGTVYPGMDAGFELDLDVKNIINPVAMAIEAICQGTTVTADFVVGKDGTNHSMAPFRVPFQGLTTVPSTTLIIKIKDSSGMTIKEQKKIVSIIARGPMFVIRDVILDTMEGLDNATFTFEILNDSKLPVSCEVSALAIEPGGTSIDLATRKLKLKGSEMLHVECTKVRIPLNAISENAIMVDFLIEIADFNKIRNLIRHRVKVDPAPGEKVDVYFHGTLKNLERTHDITAYIDKVGIEVDVRKDITLGGCKAKVIEIVDGEARKVIHTVKLPKGRDRVHETIYWKPPKAKVFPSLCKLDVQFVQDDEPITSERMHIEPLFFTIFPE